MPVPLAPVYELAVARRPSLSDVGGATLVDHAAFPPDPDTMPTAAMLNQHQYLLAALARLSPTCILWYRRVNSVSIIHTVSAGSSLLSVASFTPTRESAGIVRINWSAGLLPPMIAEPEACLTFSADAQNPAYQAMAGPQVESVANGVRVYTRNYANVVTDYNFRVAIY